MTSQFLDRPKGPNDPDGADVFEISTTDWENAYEDIYYRRVIKRSEFRYKDRSFFLKDGLGVVFAVGLLGWKKEMIKHGMALCDTYDWEELLAALNDGDWVIPRWRTDPSRP